MGLQNGRKEIPVNQSILCDRCGHFGHYRAWMSYNALTLFFIPVLKWGKRYYIESSCCHTIYELNREIGTRLAHGEKVEITSSDLTALNNQKMLEQMTEIKKVCDAAGVKLVCFSVPTTPYAESVWDLNNIHTQLATYFKSEGIEWFDGYFMKQSVFPRTTMDYRDLEGHITGSAGSRFTAVVAEILQKKAAGTYVKSDYFEAMPGVDTQ